MGAKNQVISGAYMDGKVILSIDGFYIQATKIQIDINSKNVKSYEIVDAENRKSASSAIGRAAAGAFVLGPVGLLAGVSAKRKGVYTVSLEFNDGNRSLIEIDEKRYKELITRCYQ